MSFKMLLCVPSIVLGLSSYANAAEVGYYSQPTLYENRIVFVSEGDLWTATIPESSIGPGSPPFSKPC